MAKQRKYGVNYIKSMKSFTYFSSYASGRKIRKVLKDKPNDYRRSIARLLEQYSKHNMWTFMTKLVE